MYLTVTFPALINGSFARSGEGRAGAGIAQTFHWSLPMTLRLVIAICDRFCTKDALSFLYVLGQTFAQWTAARPQISIGSHVSQVPP